MLRSKGGVNLEPLISVAAAVVKPDVVPFVGVGVLAASLNEITVDYSAGNIIVVAQAVEKL